MGRSTDAGSETVRGTSSRCGALCVSAAPRPARLSGSIRITMGAEFQSSIFRSDLDRGTERTAARIIAGSERYRLVIPLHRSARPPRMGGGHRKTPALFVTLDWSRSCRPRAFPPAATIVGSATESHCSPGDHSVGPTQEPKRSRVTRRDVTYCVQECARARPIG